jgi:DNA replication and repair protein RecF
VLNGQRLRKEVLLDGVKRALNDAVGQINAVIFVPQMSQVIEGGPEERRRLLNMTIAQVVPAYAGVLSEYNQALSQRNALLKLLGERASDAGELDVWDETLSGLGAQIMLWRIQAIDELERLAVDVQAALTGGEEALRLAYQPAHEPLGSANGQLGLKIDTVVDRTALTVDDIRLGFRAQLRQLRAEEIARGQTTVGPHRDDLRFLVNRNDLGAYGSRGQIRTALLAFKLAEVLWMRGRAREWPVILLDEVMAELDPQRRAKLLEYLRDSEQVLFTTTDPALLPADFRSLAQSWRVEDGHIFHEEQSSPRDS